MGQNNAYVSVVQDTIQKADCIFEAKFFLQIDEIHTPVKKQQQKNNPPPHQAIQLFAVVMCGR